MKLSKPLLAFFILVTLVFFLTSTYDYYTKSLLLKNSGPTLSPTITLSSPSAISQNEPIDLEWRIDSMSPQRIETTTIYYSPTSTPSAVTVADPPEALGYEYSLPDFQAGDFESPQVFKASLLPPAHWTQLFLRAYARLGSNHYWTEEIKIELK